MGRKDRPEIKELLETINKNAKRLQRLTEDVLDITRMDSKSLLLYKDKFDLNDIILDIIKNYKNSNGKGKNIKFEYGNFTSPVIIEADINRINQVITNLISNSIKFINKDEGGEEEGIIFISINKRKRTKKIKK